MVGFEARVTFTPKKLATRTVEELITVNGNYHEPSDSLWSREMRFFQWKLTGDLSLLVSLRPFLLEINQVESSSSSSSLISRSTDRTAANKRLITSFLRM